jgi:Protein of unknown function (DUF3016)
MHTPYRALLTCILLAIGRPAVSETLVTFSHPEHFTDAALNGGSGPAAIQPTLSALADYLRTIGATRLGPRQTLVVEVTNIDLAGDVEPWRAPADDVRIMRPIYPPRIALRFKLEENGRTVTDGEDRLVDLDYLANPEVLLQQGPLRYEKAMLMSWFRSRIVHLQANVPVQPPNSFATR